MKKCEFIEKFFELINNSINSNNSNLVSLTNFIHINNDNSMDYVTFGIIENSLFFPNFDTNKYPFIKNIFCNEECDISYNNIKDFINAFKKNYKKGYMMKCFYLVEAGFKVYKNGLLERHYINRQLTKKFLAERKRCQKK